LILKLGPPRKSTPTGTHRLTQKRWQYSQMCSPQLRKKSQKIFKKHLNMIFYPFAGGPTFTVFWHVSRGFGAPGAQNRWFPIDFDRRPYSATH